MSKVFSFYTDTFSKCFRNDNTYCFTKLPIIGNESAFDEKLKFIKHTPHLSQLPHEICRRIQVTAVAFR